MPRPIAVTRSLIAARRRATRSIAEALRPAHTLATAGDSTGRVKVVGQPDCIYARFLNQPTRVITAQIGAAPPVSIDDAQGWLIEVKEVLDAGLPRYRIVNWLKDAIGRPVSEAAKYPTAPHSVIFGAGTSHTGNLDATYTPSTTLAGPTGASLVGIEDAGEYYDAENVEDALQELMAPGGGAFAYRHAFSDSADILFIHPFSNRPAVTIHFNTPLGFGLRAFGTSRFGEDTTWTQEGPLAPAITSITFPLASQVHVILAAAATGEVLCLG